MNESKVNEKMEELHSIIEKNLYCFFCKSDPKNLYKPIKYLLDARGKRIRPLLTLISTGILNGDVNKAIKPAIALEFLHNFTLVHDDIMDNSDMRRNRETIHKKWNTSIGILSGDLLLAIAFQNIIADVGLDYCKEVLLTYTNSLIEVCEGQGYDLDFEDRQDVTINEYFLMIEKKTAKLIENSMVIGGMIANGKIESIRSLAAIGKSLGLAFQLQDDLLDLTAINPKFGKVVGKDIVEGKKTFIMLKAKDLLTTKDEIALLNTFFENHGLPTEQVPTMIDYLDKNGVFDVTNETINGYFSTIQSHMNNFEDNIYKDMLNSLIKSLFNREY